MAFKLEAAQEDPMVQIKQGPLRDTGEITNEIGVNLELNTIQGLLSGSIRFFAVKTELHSKKELATAIEQAINDSFKVNV